MLRDQMISFLQTAVVFLVSEDLATQHYRGHRIISSTVRYTQPATDGSKGFWRD